MEKSLDDSCEKYINKLLYVETHYGWGWSYPENKGKEVSNLDMEPIPDFTFRLLKLTSLEDNSRRGGIGIIEDDACKYNGLRISFTTRHVGVFNFDSEFPICNIFITEENSDDHVGGRGEIRSIENV